jgi:hypothetical protein
MATYPDDAVNFSLTQCLPFHLQNLLLFFKTDNLTVVMVYPLLPIFEIFVTLANIAEFHLLYLNLVFKASEVLYMSAEVHANGS